MFRLLFIFLMLLAPLSAYSSETPFESELWPGEGIPVFTAKSNLTLSIHSKADRSSNAVSSFNVKKGQKLHYDKTIYKNVKPGKVLVLKPFKIAGRNFGQISRLSREKYYDEKVPYGPMEISKNDEISYLQYRAEGHCFISKGTDVLELDYCPWIDPSEKGFRVVSEPENEWWVRVTENKKPIGWVQVQKNQFTEDRKR